MLCEYSLKEAECAPIRIAESVIHDQEVVTLVDDLCDPEVRERGLPSVVSRGNLVK